MDKKDRSNKMMAINYNKMEVKAMMIIILIIMMID